MSILVTGSVAYDLLLDYEGSFTDGLDHENLENFSLAYVTPHFAKHHGGTGANIAWNLRLLHQGPLLVATVGYDGTEYVQVLEKRGVETRRIEQKQELASSTAILATDSLEHQIIFYHPGADGIGTWPTDLSDDRDDMSYAIVSPRDQKMMMAALDWCKKSKVPVLFDPGQQMLSFSKDELAHAVRGSAGVVVNAYEWSLLSERIATSTDDILAETGYLVVTHGEEGLTIYTKEETHVIHACTPLEVINPTGAGDALRAGLLTGLSAGWSLRDAGRLGAALASFVVEQAGTLLHDLDINEVLGRAEVTYGEMLPELP